MREAAECRRRRLRCLRAKGASRCAPCWASSSARRQRLPVESRWDAKDLRFKLAAGIASVLGRLLGLRTEQVKKLIPVGAAAAIAAAFNTPLAAVLFSLEEIVGDLHAPVMGAVVLASATSWMVLRVFLGNHPSVQSSAISTGPSAGVCGLCRARRGRRCGFGGLHEAPAGHAGALPAVPAEDGLVPTRSGRVAGRSDGLVCAAGLGRGLWVCRRRFERKDGVQV